MMQLYYPSWRDVPEELWMWPHFRPVEIACKGSGAILINPAALNTLQRLRDALGQPIALTSAYRSPAHNAAVGGAKNSKHMMGIAFDVRNSTKYSRERLLEQARLAGFNGFGLYRDFVHMDMGARRSWSG